MENKEQVFTRMVREHKSTIYTVCYMFSKDTDEIDDLFQEILIRLWKGYDSFRSESDVRTWIYRAAMQSSALDVDQAAQLATDGLKVDEAPFRSAWKSASGRDEWIAVDLGGPARAGRWKCAWNPGTRSPLSRINAPLPRNGYCLSGEKWITLRKIRRK